MTADEYTNDIYNCTLELAASPGHLVSGLGAPGLACQWLLGPCLTSNFKLNCIWHRHNRRHWQFGTCRTSVPSPRRMSSPLTHCHSLLTGTCDRLHVVQHGARH
jgi:hypothetical protein